MIVEEKNETKILILANSALPQAAPQETKNSAFFEVMLSLFAQVIHRLECASSSGEHDAARADARLLMSAIRRFYKDESEE